MKKWPNELDPDFYHFRRISEKFFERVYEMVTHLPRVRGNIQPRIVVVGCQRYYVPRESLLLRADFSLRPLMNSARDYNPCDSVQFYKSSKFCDEEFSSAGRLMKLHRWGFNLYSCDTSD